MFVCPECGASQPMPGVCTNDRAQFAPIGDDYLIGTTIGAYRVSRLLGVGGMGRVYKGVQPAIGSRVAIKVLSRECSDRRELVERFFSEAKAVNLIRHEGIVNVLDLASLPDGRPYIIMEYLDGAPLASAIESVAQRGPLPMGGIVRLAVEVLDALGAAHAKGIVHRDLKPDNIFVTPAGRPKVLDFGIAKLLPELGGSFTQTGSLLGTPHYMAPEQAAGKPVDYRVDLYAMGIILFECVTGSKPFHGDSLFDLLRKHVDTPPPLPRTIRPDLPPAFEYVILTALAKAPEHRFPSAYAMSVALQEATAQLPAEQWAPIYGGSSSASIRVPSAAGWSGAQPPTPMPGYPPVQPTVSVAHPAMYPPVHPTTTSGQVAAPTAVPTKSRAGVWLPLAVLVAAGGIIAAIAVTQSGGAKTAAAPPSAPPSVPTAPAPAERPAAPAQIAITPPTSPVAPPQPPVAGAPWMKAHAVHKDGWDAKNVDVDEFIAWAKDLAKQTIPDAEMFRMDAANVYPDGHADLTLSNSGFISVRFISPSRSKRDPSAPIGVEPHWHCMFQIMGTVQTGPFMVPMDDNNCEVEHATPPTRCNTRGVWQQMIAMHAPSGNVVASIGYWASNNEPAPLWYGNIGNTFSKRFPDKCP